MSYSFTLGPKLAKKVKNELNEDPDRRADDIEHIRNWIIKQPHLNAKTDDWSILQFLRGCKFSLERTKEKIDMHYSMKTAIPEWFSNRDPTKPKLLELLKMGLFIPLPGVDNDGRKVFINRVIDIDMKKYELKDVMKNLYNLVDVSKEEDEIATITGIVVIIDMKKFNTSQMLWYTPTNTKKIMLLWQEAYPLRPKSLHFINTNSKFESIFSFFKSFLKDKMKKRVFVYGKNLRNLHVIVPKSILPEEYGGTNGKFQDMTNNWVNRMVERRDFLINEETFRVDESKRRGMPKSSIDLFGLEGSFRKLNLD